MVEVQIPRIQVTCVYCGQSLHEPVDWISLNPVCPNCEASRPLRPSAVESRRQPRGSRAPGDRNEVSSLLSDSRAAGDLKITANGRACAVSKALNDI